jgi:phosphoglycerol transferase MdoB-like AlkP superfamily enzyme
MESYKNFIKNLGVLLASYSLSRCLFLGWNWKSFQIVPSQEILQAFVVGLRFDISAICYINFIFLFLVLLPKKEYFLKIEWLIFWIVNSIFLILNFGDTEFVNFVGRRLSSEALFILKELSGKTLEIAWTFWPIALSGALILGGVLFTSWKWCFKSPKESVNHFRKKQALVFMAMFLFFAVGTRGGFQLKPLNFVQAQVFKVPLLNNMVLNSSFTLIKSFNKPTISRKKLFSTDSGEDLKNYLNGQMKDSLKFNPSPFKKPQNVVILIVESLSSEYMYVESRDPQTYTPFLDSLAEKSVAFKNSFSNGRRSIEGIVSILAGIPALMSEPFITSPFQTNTFFGLGTILNQNGYETAFFHGGHNGTMFFDSFTRAAGFDKYFGFDQYPDKKDDDGVWGIWDEPFLKFSLQQMDQLKKPFAASVFTLSSHHPYAVPADFQNQFPKGTLKIHESIGYADYALKKFFEEAAHKDWYNDTLFVITGDHTGLSHHEEASFDKYRVPIIIYSPQWKSSEVYSTENNVSQIDIVPTLLDLLKLKTSSKNYLGESVFIQGDRVVLNYLDSQYYLRSEDAESVWNLEGQNVSIKSLTGNEISEERKLILQKKVKAHIDYFNQGMWDNALYF